MNDKSPDSRKLYSPLIDFTEQSEFVRDAKTIDKLSKESVELAIKSMSSMANIAAPTIEERENLVTALQSSGFKPREALGLHQLVINILYRSAYKEFSIQDTLEYFTPVLKEIEVSESALVHFESLVNGLKEYREFILIEEYIM